MPADVPLCARQPIFDADLNIVAYELLFRHSEENSAGFIDGDHATSNVLLNVFGDQELDRIIGQHKAFINFTRNLILNPPILPKKRFVIEILEDIEADDELIEAVKKLKKIGFTIALDDFFLNKHTKKLVHYADIIKVDVLALSEEQLKKYVEVLKPLDIKLLAEKVENHEMYNLCRKLGFDWYQGYFFCKPEIIRGIKVSESKQAILRLVSTLNTPDPIFNQIVEALSSDPTLSYKLLRLVNSSAVGLPNEVNSLSQAVSLLGLRSIQNWATFILLANNDDKPQELCFFSLCTAKFSELLGMELKGKEFSDSCFTAGLLSYLDAFLDLPMEKLVDSLKLSTPIEEALLIRAGNIGEILQIVEHYEKGHWDLIDWKELESDDITPSKLNSFYGDAVLWATDMMQHNA